MIKTTRNSSGEGVYYDTEWLKWKLEKWKLEIRLYSVFAWEFTMEETAVLTINGKQHNFGWQANELSMMAEAIDMGNNVVGF